MFNKIFLNTSDNIFIYTITYTNVTRNIVESK